MPGVRHGRLHCKAGHDGGARQSDGNVGAPTTRPRWLARSSVCDADLPREGLATQVHFETALSCEPISLVIARFQ